MISLNKKQLELAKVLDLCCAKAKTRPYLCHIFYDKENKRLVSLNGIILFVVPIEKIGISETELSTSEYWQLVKNALYPVACDYKYPTINKVIPSTEVEKEFSIKNYLSCHEVKNNSKSIGLANLALLNSLGATAFSGKVLKFTILIANCLPIEFDKVEYSADEKNGFSRPWILRNSDCFAVVMPLLEG